AVLGADPAADLDAHVCAWDVIETHPVQAANLHVLDRLGLYGKIGCLRPSYRNEPRCRAKEKTFHHLHLEPPKKVSFERVPYPLSATAPFGTSPCSPLARETFRTWCKLQPGQHNRGMPPPSLNHIKQRPPPSNE